jgi:ABC-type antimicrobial peptide transport system permease subunit
MFIPIKYNLRYLMTRWTNTLMTAATFALVVAVFVIIMSLARGIERALTSTGDPLNVLIMRPGAQSEGQSSIDIERYHVVRSYPGIARDETGEPLAAPEIIVLVNKPKAGDGKPSNLQIRGVNPLVFKIRPEVRIVEGRAFRPGLREVIVSRSVSRRFKNMSIGETPQIGKVRMTIVGIFEARGSAIDSEMWADYREIMQAFDRQTYSTVVVRARDAAAVDAILRTVAGDRRIKLSAKTEMKYYQEQTSTAGPLKAFGIFLAVIMSIGASFAGMNAMYASVASRVREIATLRVLGFTPFSILASFLIESVFLALIGGLLGCALSLPINGLATGTTNFQTFSEIVFYFTITPDLMLRGLIFAAVMGAVGGILPALAAARQPILQALRQA